MGDQIFMAELQDLLGRNERTIRCWVRDAARMARVAGEGVDLPDGYLPSGLRPQQEENGRKRIFWSPDQIDGLRAFAEEKDRRKGWQASRS